MYLLQFDSPALNFDQGRRISWITINTITIPVAHAFSRGGTRVVPRENHYTRNNAHAFEPKSPGVPYADGENYVHSFRITDVEHDNHLMVYQFLP